MSVCEIQKVTCPNCGAEQDEKVFVSVNGARIKQAADRIVAGTWGEIACLACGARYLRDAPLLYTDLPGKLWIVQHANAERNQFATLEKEADVIFEREFIDRPPAAIRNQAAAVKRRICFGRSQLVEKLLALRHGIDDRALECLKLLLLRDYVQEWFAYGPTEFRLLSVDGDILSLAAMPISDGRPMRTVRVPWQEVRKISQELEKFESSFPELFKELYVNASRYVTETAA